MQALNLESQRFVLVHHKRNFNIHRFVKGTIKESQILIMVFSMQFEIYARLRPDSQDTYRNKTRCLFPHEQTSTLKMPLTDYQQKNAQNREKP